MKTSDRTHRARTILRAASRPYPSAWKQVDAFRQMKGADLDDWPSWCYMPIAAGYAVVSGGGPNRVPLALADHPAIVTGLATWRMTQGIYRFDPAVLEALADTPLAGDLPTALLYRLPEWCVYVEFSTPLGARTIHGFWAWLEYDVARGGTRELRLLFDAAPNPDRPLDGARGLISIPLSLEAPDLETAWRVIASSGARELTTLGVPVPSETVDTLAGSGEAGVLVRKAVSLLLYLCAENGDIVDRGRTGRQPGNPEPRKTRRRGMREFAANSVREWDVGVRMGSALRAAYQREQTGQDQGPTGRQVRPHVRRAHWHTFLTGPRKRKDGSEISALARRRELRWMPPIAVNLEDAEQLPATIRPVD